MISRSERVKRLIRVNKNLQETYGFTFNCPTKTSTEDLRTLIDTETETETDTGTDTSTEPKKWTLNYTYYFNLAFDKHILELLNKKYL